MLAAIPDLPGGDSFRQRSSSDGLVGRIEIDEIAGACLFQNAFERPAVYRCSLQYLTCQAEIRFVSDLGILVLAEGNVELPAAIDAIQAVEACFVEIDQARRP